MYEDYKNLWGDPFKFFFLWNIKELEIREGALSKLESGQSITGGNDNEELWKKLKISYQYSDK
jgi:hypothetical protein